MKTILPTILFALFSMNVSANSLKEFVIVVPFGEAMNEAQAEIAAQDRADSYAQTICEDDQASASLISSDYSMGGEGFEVVFAPSCSLE